VLLGNAFQAASPKLFAFGSLGIPIVPAKMQALMICILGHSMFYRMMIGAAALTLCLAANGRCIAAGAVAVGEPADIAKDGVAIFTFVRAESADIAKQKALAGCKALPHASDTSKALCKIVATFEDQCVAQALDPQDGTPGFGWAMARNLGQAKAQALSNCRDTAGPARKDACIVNERSLWCDGSAK
jgi:hypothetical protein